MTTSPELNTVHTQFGIFALIIFLKKSKKKRLKNEIFEKNVQLSISQVEEDYDGKRTKINLILI